MQYIFVYTSSNIVIHHHTSAYIRCILNSALRGMSDLLFFSFLLFLSKHNRFSTRPVCSTDSFRTSLPDLDIFIRRGQHFSLRGNLHGPRFTEDREFIPGLPRYSRPVRRLSGYDIRRGERSSWLLGVWTAILRHLDRFWRYVQHCLYSESLRNLSRSLHSHKGPAQVNISIPRPVRPLL